jgi:hypothetical protein
MPQTKRKYLQNVFGVLGNIGNAKQLVPSILEQISKTKLKTQ